MPIEGIFFENQILTAQGLGAFGDAALSDGILTGCEVSYSNHGFSISEGYIVVRGRVIKVGANTRIENVTVGTSAVAYTAVIATVDTTQGSTEESFNQVSFSVAQGTSISAVTQVTSLDINLTGRSASAVIAIVNASKSSPEVLGYIRSVGKSMTKLWSMEPVAKNAWTETIPAICAYDALLIVYKRTIGDSWYTSRICIYEKGVNKNYTHSLSASYINGDLYNCINQRLVTINGANGTVSFSNGWYATGGSVGAITSEASIPVAIYGMAVH